MADSHTGNHPKDDFTPLETIRRSYSVIRERIPFELEGETFEPERRGTSSSPQSNVMYASMNALLSTLLANYSKAISNIQAYVLHDSITTQTCELSQEEFNDFLALYPVPSEYHVILPKSNQTVFDAPPGYVGLYTHSFSLANLRLPLTEFFCEVLEYFQVHISRLNPFGCAKFTTFVVICKAYGCEPSIDLFRGFFNLFRAGKWLTFAKRCEKHILNLLPKVITRIKGWHEQFFYVQDSIIPAKHLQLLSEQNKLNLKSFKDKLPPNIEENPITGSPSISGNKEPLKANEEPDIQPVEVTVDFGGIPKPELFVVHPGSVAARIKDRKCLSYVLELKDANACHLKISTITHPAWKNHLDNHIDLELLDLYDRCYSKQAVVDNAVNRRSRELLQVIKKLRGECDVMRSKERARNEECEGLRVKCEAAMTDFEKNPAVVAFREKISALSTEAKEHKLSLDRMMLESQKWAGYQ
ncbi:hypothetical protein Tco_1246222 [Tanacetum coccineum]